MKKLVILFTGIVITSASFSQVSIGIQGIGNLGSAKVKAEDLASPSKTVKAMPGAGIVADVSLNNNFMVRTGINFLQNGVKIKITQPGTPGEIDAQKIEASTKLNYLQVPLYAAYISSGELIKFYAGAGPYVSYGIGGKLTSTVTTEYTSGDKDVQKDETSPFKKDGEDGAAFKRFDAGVGAIAGIKFPNGIFANVGYQFSLTNINNDNAGVYKSRGLQLSIGYFLWRK